LYIICRLSYIWKRSGTFGKHLFYNVKYIMLNKYEERKKEKEREGGERKREMYENMSKSNKTSRLMHGLDVCFCDILRACRSL